MMMRHTLPILLCLATAGLLIANAPPDPATDAPVTQQVLPEIKKLPGFDPQGADTSALLTEAKALFEAQNWEQAEARYRKALESGLKRDAAWDASNQIMLCALRLGQHERALQAAADTVGRFQGTIDEARAWRVLGNLYLELPHWGTDQGGKFHRAIYGQGRYHSSYRTDRALAVQALEKMRDTFAARATQTERGEQCEALFDLVRAVVSFGPYDATWWQPWWAWSELEEGEDDEEMNGNAWGRGRCEW